jgi:hypothetical protein
MSFRKYGGTNKLEKNNNITVHSIVADTFTIRDAFLSLFTIEGDLKIGGNGIISNNLNVSQQINGATLDISLNATIEGNLYLDKMKDVFFSGNNTMIGLNKSNPTATLDISSNQVQAFNLKTSAANNRNIIARNFTDNGIAVTATGTTESGIQFYSANTGTIDVSNAQGALIKYSNTDSLLSIDSTGGDVKVASKMIITDNTTNGNAHTAFGETVLIYDKDNGVNQSVFFNEAYGNTNVKTGSALTVQSINNASNTFMNIVTPSRLGIQLGGGSYPKDPTRSMGVIDVYHPAIDVDATPAMCIVSGDSVTKYNSTTGFNTFQPKYNNYAVDINGPLHLNNGEVKKIIETTARITELYNYGSNYGIAIGGQGTEENNAYYAYTTMNGGKSWTKQNQLNDLDRQNIIPDDETFNAIYSYDLTRTIVAGTGGLAYLTDDSGVNWTQLIVGTGITTINGIYTPPDISKDFVYVGGTSELNVNNSIIRYGYIESYNEPITAPTRYRYTDLSYNYTIVGGKLSDFAGYGQKLLVVGGNEIRKFDLGVSKMTLTLTSTYTNPGSVTYSAVRLVDDNNGVAVGGNVISYTKNGGTTWTTANIPSLSGKTFNDVFLDSSMNAIVVGNNGYIYSSNDGYYTWKIVDEDVLNASGVGSRITDPTNDITSVFMPDSSTIILSIVKNNDSNARAGKLYYLNMPNIFNNKQNFLFDVSGCMRISGDLVLSEGAEIISKDSTFNFVTKNVATLNAATSALAINIGGTNTTNIAMGGANTVNLLAGGINTSSVIIGGNVTNSKIGPLNISSLTSGNVTLSNNLVTGNVYANSIVLTNNLDVNNGIIRVNSTNNSTSATTGSLVVYGGLGVAKDIYSAGNINALSDINLSGNLYSSGNTLVMTSSDNIIASIAGNSIVFTSNTGTLQIGGGTIISKNIYIGGTTFCGGDLVVQGQISYLGGTVSTSTTFSSAIAASPLRGNSNSNVNYSYTYKPLDPPTDYNEIGFGAGALTTEGGFAVALDSWLIGNIRVDGTNNIISRTVESSSTDTGALQIRGGVGIGMNVNIGGNTIIYSSVESTSTNSGALRIIGGVGIGGNVYTGGNVISINTAESTSTVTGALQIRGGVGIGRNAHIGGNTIIYSNIESTSINTGALQIIGGVGIGGNVYTGGNIISINTSQSTSTVTGALQIRGGVGIGMNAHIGGNTFIYSSVESTSTNSGALQIIGGVGIGGNVYTGGNIISINTSESTSTITGALQIRGGVGIGMNAHIGGNTFIYSNIESTSTNSGALRIIGGVGIGGNVYTGGNIISINTSESTSTVTGALQIRGGIGIGMNAHIGGNTFIYSSVESTSTNTGALQIIGGVGIGGNVYTGGNIISINTSESTSTVTGALQIRGGVGIGRNVHIGGNTIIYSTIESTSTVTGALQIRGGVGIGMNAHIGGNVIIYSTSESNSTITGALQIRGGVGIGGNVNISRTTIILDENDSASVSSGALQVRGGLGVSKKITSQTLSTGAIAATTLNLSSGSASNTTASGALIVAGGIGVGGSVHVGGSIYTNDLNTTGQMIFSSSDDSNSIANGAVVISGGLGLAKNLNVGGGTTLIGTLNVDGGTTLKGTLNVIGASRQAAITASGLVTANAGLTIASGQTLTANGISTLAVTTITGGLVVTGGRLIVSGVTNNITATGNTANSFNVLTANGGGGSYNKLTVGSGSVNYITATDGGANTIQGPATFENFAPNASGVTINNTNGLTIANGLNVRGTPTVNGGGINVSGNTLLKGPNVLSMWGGGGGFGLGLDSSTVKYHTALNHRFYTDSPSTNATDGTLRATIDTTGLTVANNLSVGGTLSVTGETVLGNIVKIGNNAFDNYDTKSIFFGGLAGDNDYNHTVIESRLYGLSDQSELLLFKANDGDQDRIRLRAGQIAFDVYGGNLSSTTPDRTSTNIIMTVTTSGINLSQGGKITINDSSVGTQGPNSISLFGSTNAYGFGINTDTLKYCSHYYHKFFTGSSGITDGTERLQVNPSGIYVIGSVTANNGLSVTGGNVTGITKAHVGLANVDNTSDLGKPISTLTQNALDNKASTTSVASKANTASPTFTGTVTAVTINASGTITANTFNANSDMRIKKDITEMNSESSLKILRKIKPREYTMIDAKDSVYGFVAQEVKEVIPKSTQLLTSFIPSVYENAFVDGNIITLINKSTTDISCCRLKLRDETNKEVIVNVTSIKDNKTFTIDTDISNNIFCMDICGNKLDKNTNNGTITYMLGSQVYTGEVKQGIFIYGIEIDDFHTINKDTIFTVALSATQEMDSQLQEARRTIRTLEERIAAIERRLS